MKRVLVILDDVDGRRQLDYLARECEWFGSWSRIIITTTHKDLVAIDGANKSYEPRKLNDEEAIKLSVYMPLNKMFQEKIIKIFVRMQ